MFAPWERMLQRYSTDKDESDIAAFYCLLFFGEMITKTLVAAMVAGVREDADRTRYGLLHELVRADGIGDWAASLDQIVTGPISQHLSEEFRVYQRELAQRQAKGTWQHDAVTLLHSAAGAAGIAMEPLSHTVAVRQWFSLFAILRNKTRGHGAVRGDECARVLPALEASIMLLRENLSVFSRPWAYLHRNLSGKYRVTRLSDDTGAFSSLKRESQINLHDGVSEINREAWESLHSDTSRPFEKPRSGRIAVKVINHLGDEVMKVFRV